MKKVICNIPHAGLEIPDWALADFIVSPQKIIEITEFMTDKNIDKLFDFVDPANKVVSSFSRIIVDTERYRDDTDEPMAELGMGLFYTHDYKGNLIRNKGSSYNQCLDIYDKYHEELNNKTTVCLQENGECIILDCHSFHDEMKYVKYTADIFPDICIGFNETDTPKYVITLRELLESDGYKVKLNIPFSGSIIPTRYINNEHVRSVMIEFNRRIYDKNAIDYEKCKKLCIQIYDFLNIA